MISDVDPVLVPLNKSFLVGHDSVGTERRAADKSDEFASFHGITAGEEVLNRGGAVGRPKA